MTVILYQRALPSAGGDGEVIQTKIHVFLKRYYCLMETHVCYKGNPIKMNKAGLFRTFINSASVHRKYMLIDVVYASCHIGGGTRKKNSKNRLVS